MKKKEYITPSTKAYQLQSSELLTITSDGTNITMSRHYYVKDNNEINVTDPDAEAW